LLAVAHGRDLPQPIGDADEEAGEGGHSRNLPKSVADQSIICDFISHCCVYY
jgi:hypothetical protein